MLAAAPLVLRFAQDRRRAGALRRRSLPLSRRLLEPADFIFSGSNPERLTPELAEREGLLAAAPLVLRFAQDRRRAKALRRRSLPLSRRLLEPADFIFSGSNPERLTPELAEREGFEPSKGF